MGRANKGAGFTVTNPAWTGCLYTGRLACCTGVGPRSSGQGLAVAAWASRIRRRSKSDRSATKCNKYYGINH